MPDTMPASAQETPAQGISRTLQLAAMHNIPVEQGLGAMVVRDAEEDDTSRSDWKTRHKEVTDILRMKRVAKDGRDAFPFEGASNVIYPLLPDACLSFANRAMSAVFGDDDLVSCVVNGEDVDGSKAERADRVAHHLSWQLLEEMPEWEADTRRLLHLIPAEGCVFRKVWWSLAENRPISCLVRAEDLIVNNNISSLRTSPRTTLRHMMWPHEIEENVRAGLFNDVEYGLKPDLIEEQEFYDQMRRMDLDGDGYAEPYTVTVHVKSGEVARVRACFGTRLVQNIGGDLMVAGQGGMEPAVARPGDVIVRGGRVERIIPLQYYVKYGLIPALDGTFYDWGFGHLIGDLSESVSALLRQSIDAGILRNAGGGLLSREFKGRQEDIAVAPGVFRQVDVSAEALAKGVLPNPNPDPSVVVLQLMEVLVEASQRMTSQTDVAQGDIAAQMAPTTMMGLTDQALTGFKGIFKGIWQSLTDDIRMVADLNRLYMEEGRYFRFQDEQRKIILGDYADDMAIRPSADPDTFSPMQRMSRAQMLLGMVGTPGLDAKELLDEAFRLMRFGSVERFLAEPQPDPNAQQIAMMLQLQIMEARAKIEKMMAETGKVRAETLKTGADAVKTVAEAEAEEVNRPFESYLRDLDALKSEAELIGKRADARERVQRMEATGGNPRMAPGIGPTSQGYS